MVEGLLEVFVYPHNKNGYISIFSQSKGSYLQSTIPSELLLVELDKHKTAPLMVRFCLSSDLLSLDEITAYCKSWADVKIWVR